MSYRRVILDVDAGIDDAYAILILLHGEKLKKLKIEAITLSMGNTSLQNVSKNVIRLLELVGRTDIPVYKGAEEPLTVENPITPTHFGRDGFADLAYEKEPDTSIICTKPAALAIHDIILSNAREISVVCLGPLTNLALALKLYPHLANDIQDLFLMGGNYRGMGNVTAAAEFNFYVDPEAAHIVLQSATCPVTVLPLETCIKTSIDVKWRFEVLANVDVPQMRLLNKAELKVYSTKKIRKNIWAPCDGFLAAAIVHPTEMIVRKSEHHASVELHGSLSRGQMILDHLKCREPNVAIIEQIDAEFFKKFLLDVIKN